VLNRDALRTDRPYVSFRASAPLPELAVDEVREAFSFGPQSGRTGNLHVLNQALGGVKGAALLARTPAGVFSVEAFFPVAL